MSVQRRKEVALSATFALGGTFRQPMPREHVVDAYEIVLDYDHATDGSANGTGSFYSDMAERLFGRITVNVPSRGGSKPVLDVEGKALGHLSAFWDPTRRVQVDPSDLSASASQTGRQAGIRLPFRMPHSIASDEFALPANSRDGGPELVIRPVGAEAELLEVASPGAVTFSNLDLDVYEIWRTAPLFPGDDYSMMFARTYEAAVTQSGTTRVEVTGLDGLELRAVLVEALSGGSGGTNYEASDALIDTVQLEVGDTVHVDETPWAILQRENARDYNLGSVESGAVLLDAAADKLTVPGQLWPISGVSDPVVSCDVTTQAGEELVRVTAIAVARRLGAGG